MFYYFLRSQRPFCHAELVEAFCHAELVEVFCHAEPVEAGQKSRFSY
jgi:hypothetical protein